MNKVVGRDIVHKELAEYHRLKRRWGLGHIKIKLSECNLRPCKAQLKRISHNTMKNIHTNVIGYYLDENDDTRQAFLGYTLKDTHARLEDVKRFLSF